MKDSYPNKSLVRFCRLFGITRQAYYQQNWQQEALSIETHLIIAQVKAIRKLHPAIGCRKLYVMLQPFLLEHQIKIGRDALFDLLAAHKLLVRKRKRKIQTTWSKHWMHKYTNLITDVIPTKVNEIWVADITYCATASEGFMYISFITDAYSKKIIGYHAADTLEAVNSVKALQMALAQCQEPLHQTIHHSDRGSQYCSKEYVAVLQSKGIHISMSENGDPLENAIAERINGIIKEEYLNHYKPKNKKEVTEKLAQAVRQYNNYRPHMSCNMLTPDEVHTHKLKVQKQWKNYYQTKNINIVNPI
jgi:transposase InsO family protein